MPRRWRLRIGAICTAIFICGYSGRWRSLIAAGRCAKATVFCWPRGNHPAFCEVLFAALGLGIEVVPFSTKLKQAESEALVGHIAPRVVLFDATVQDWLKTPLTRVRFHSANGRRSAFPNR
ncbi:hypothetical protein IE996_07705 [Klebsiella pneumoniae]|uniref:Uncharacterized protein n=1 Tax=Klebsiella pneumoniae TaxID=573 RepID=A0A927HNZ5_KLEPN|nr:hypothetical protein [Klebsiella pneumoniae]